METTTENVRKVVIEAVCRSLAVEPDEVGDDTRLIVELGMDSLDFLDVMFTLEKEFNMKIRDAEFDRVLRPDKSEAVLENEFLNDGEIARLAPLMPALKEAAEKGDVPRREVFSFVTLETFVKMVERKVHSTSGDRS